MTEQNILEANKALMCRWFEEVWNQGSPEAVCVMMSEDCINHGLSEDGKPMRGPADFLPFHTQFREAFPNIEVVVEDTLAEGDLAAVRADISRAGETLPALTVFVACSSPGKGVPTGLARSLREQLHERCDQRARLLHSAPAHRPR